MFLSFNYKFEVVLCKEYVFLYILIGNSLNAEWNEIHCYIFYVNYDLHINNFLLQCCIVIALKLNEYGNDNQILQNYQLNSLISKVIHLLTLKYKIVSCLLFNIFVIYWF